MTILLIIPPYVPSYFNAGHHLPIFSAAAYLRSKLEAKITCLDCAALNTTWKDICDILIAQYDYIVVFNDFDAIDGFGRFISYCNEYSPQAKTITFGRLSNQIPGFFRQFNFDAMICSGDYESGILNAIHYLSGSTKENPGFVVKKGEEYIEPGTKGVFLLPQNWELPDISEIPYLAYQFLYKNDLNKFCGIPDRLELVVPIARGCPVGCSFCDVPKMQGTAERRISEERTLNYITDCFAKFPFEYVSFYCPTFTLNKKWVENFCSLAIKRGQIYPWKCVTVADMLTEDLVRVMSLAGNIRISVGLETFSENAGKQLPKIKRDAEAQFDRLVQWCSRYNTELNCFVILGLPDDSLAGIKYTIDKIQSVNGRVRPTIYTPYEMLHESMSVEEVAQFNRQFLHGSKYNPLEKREIYELFFKNDRDISTSVANNIPKRQFIK